MKTLKVQYYSGGAHSVPGGVIIRSRRLNGTMLTEYLVHNFGREPGSTTPTSFFWGKYTTDETKADIAFQRKVASMRNFLVDEDFINSSEITS